MESVEKLKKRVWVAGSSAYTVGWVSVLASSGIYFWSIFDESFYESGLSTPTFFGAFVSFFTGITFIYFGRRIKNNPDTISLNDFKMLLWVYGAFFLWLIMTGSQVGILALLLSYYFISGYRAIVKLSLKKQGEQILLIPGEKIETAHTNYPSDGLKSFFKEKNRYILFLVFVVSFLAILFFVIQDGLKIRNIKDGATMLPNIENGDFSKKVTCSDLKPKIVAELNEEAVRTKKNISLYKIFFSREKNSCLFAYVVEDDYQNRQCDLNAEIVHYDSFVVEDYLSGQIVLRNTKGCYGYWADSFDARIDLLEKGMPTKNKGDFETSGRGAE